MSVAMSIFQRLIQTPIFQGMSNDDLSRVVSYIKFDFFRIVAGNDIVVNGEQTTQLLLISTGDIAVEQESDDHGYSLVEFFHAPCLVQPERLFGRTTYYTHSVKALTDVNVIALPKNELLSLCADFLVVRLNLLNILSTNAQRLYGIPWHRHPLKLEEEFTAFVTHRCSRPAGKKALTITMERLAHELGTTRIRVSRMLNQLKAKGCVDYTRGKITIPLLEKLINA